MTLHLIDVALLVAAALDDVGITHSVGGALASSFSGETRFTQDVDIVVDLRLEQVGALVSALGPDFYADVDALGRAVRTRSSVNVIHMPTSIKVDLFVVGGSPLDQMQLARRQRRQVSQEPDAYLYFHSHEDIVLQKLLWYRLGGEVSDRQWRDVQSIVKKQGERLDRDYLRNSAESTGILDLLTRLLPDG
jgi:hypothetical protein